MKEATLRTGFEYSKLEGSVTWIKTNVMILVSHFQPILIQNLLHSRNFIYIAFDFSPLVLYFNLLFSSTSPFFFPFKFHFYIEFFTFSIFYYLITFLLLILLLHFPLNLSLILYFKLFTFPFIFSCNYSLSSC